jgi:ribosomal protein S18 acetylase RimI-like enzyme
MVKLTPMTQPEFDAFLEADILSYAHENVLAGYWSETEAMARSRKEHKALLPKGPKSLYHHFYTIRDAKTEQAVGVLWFRTDLDSSRGSAHIFDLEIDEPYRRQGYARAAMQELENVARGMGLRQLGLHVFAHNGAARGLYDALGYQVASLNMLKDL